MSAKRIWAMALTATVAEAAAVVVFWDRFGAMLSSVAGVWGL